MKRRMLIFVGASFLLSACNSNQEEQELTLSTEPINVEVLNDTTATLDEEWTLQVEVTQEDEPVEDANEVIIEVWTEGNKENSAMIPAEHSADGIYEAELAFQEKDTTYSIQPHVTARGMHSMPVHEVEVTDE
ncbi:FixH family protein [Geomicrobium sp. JCM 19055]|uniref:FixH family protein n=1 Tax=Geomicrobium sp. JCM 19055 TaxID=1460649 RepID=UPI00045ECF17|nr:FixH family protein [Geomicrobium sp. JCM 19055]GAK01703.1 hypothetical protein JCM19055_4905 [Geomicrobium sp. JCM 19055]